MNFQLCEEIGLNNSKSVMTSGDYIYQLKIDGERVIAIKRGNDVELWNRNRKTNEYNFLKNEQYPEVVEELKAQEHDFIIDGEIASADFHNGINVLNQRALASSPFKIKLLIDKIPIKFYVFDMIMVDNRFVANLPLINRINALNSFLMETKHIEILEHHFDFKKLWKKVIEENLEGIVAKRKDSPYKFERNTDWVKVKNTNEIIVNCLGYKQDSKRSKFGSMITDRCNVSLLTQANKDFYLKHKPKKAVLKYYGTYPSGKLRNPIFLRWELSDEELSKALR